MSGWGTAFRQSEAVVDLDAVAHNVSHLKRKAGTSLFCAVVKADAYGHGAVPVARTVAAAGADYVGVALVEEAEELRRAGVDIPVLLLSEPPPGSEARVVALDVEPTVYTRAAIAAMAEAAVAARTVVGLHLKVNTGMNRVGSSPREAPKLAAQIAESAGVRVAGMCTHFAVADEPGNDTTAHQADLFRAVLDEVQTHGIDTGIRHAANTAAVLVAPRTLGFDMVRCGIGVYGIAPVPALRAMASLRPALTLRSELVHVAHLAGGEGISYGHRYVLERDTWIGTVPLGYADGVRRGLTGRMHVLVRGRRRPIAGTITMDQLLVDLGQKEHARGEEVVLIGRQGAEEVTVEDWADALGTIGYEITCGISSRVPRRYVGRDGREGEGDA
ncbi:MAG: alanine racemase [Acidimicrobiia bacterium]|nr:alanine racemase [Acidimicrobiia bacterium]